MHLRPIEQKIYHYLSDGLAHPKEEVRKACMDPYTGAGVFHVHLCELRKKLEMNGKTVTVFNRYGMMVQMTALIISENNPSQNESKIQP